jgi:4-hydroxy-tetrahydrodipicolinate reductase
MKRKNAVVLAINGVCGRLGQRIFHVARQEPGVIVGATLEAPGHPDQGKDVGEVLVSGACDVPISAELPDKRFNVLIDCSHPEATMAILPVCVERRIPMVIGTTGHTRAQREEIEAAAHQTAVLLVPNLGLGANVLFRLVREAATMLKQHGFDVEIVERHHRQKKDSPSGTAMHLAHAIQRIMGQTEIRHGREGAVGERSPNEIGIHAIRVGDNVGEHTVIFSGAGETLELSHKAHSRDCYARGAVQAAKFLADRPPGRFSMDDVLGYEKVLV